MQFLMPDRLEELTGKISPGAPVHQGRLHQQTARMYGGGNGTVCATTSRLQNQPSAAPWVIGAGRGG